MLGALAVSLFRTYVPLVVGALVTLASVFSLDLDSEAVLAALTVGASAVYYTAVRWLEERVSPKFGYLLGIAEKPIYVSETVAIPEAEARGEVGAD
jgi:hypothetical protein